MDLQVVAEEIESVTAESMLRDLGCRPGQRFHYGLPMGADAILANLAASSGASWISA